MIDLILINAKNEIKTQIGLSYLNVSSPKIRLFKVETLEEDLQTAGVEFCKVAVQVDLTKKSVTLPDFLLKYQHDFGPTRREILIWLFQFLDSKKKLDLFGLLEEKSYSVAVEPIHWNLRVEDRTELAPKKDYVIEAFKFFFC